MIYEPTPPKPKRCSKCGVEYPATTEWFGCFKHGKNGLRAQCKACVRNYRAANVEHIREYQHEWHAANAERIAQQKRKWRAANAERIAQQKRKWRAANAEHIREYQHEHRIANAEHIAKQCCEYRAARLEQRRIWRHKRRSLKNNIPFDFTSEDWQRCLEYWEHSCCICGRKIGLWHVLAQEHWIAIADPRPDNPGTVPTNILPMCHARKGVPAGESCCNNSKINKDPETWLIERFGKRKAAQILKRINAYFEWVRQQDSEDKTA